MHYIILQKYTQYQVCTYDKQMKKETYEKKKKNDKYIIIYNRIKQNKLIIISDTNRKTKKLGKEKQIHITNLKLLKILINLN